MEPNEILKQIQPCNTDKSYVFISYSSKDKERVWEDVLRFQQMGYNVWLDEKNLDKTKNSWRADALTAIQRRKCALLVFYVSRNSLVSDACYSELKHTKAEITYKLRNKHNLPCIAVDAEPIDDIIRFRDEVYDEVAGDDSLKEEEQDLCLLTLADIIEDVFNSNNERIRVKARNLPNRKMDYYEEITASFPDKTRILPVAEPVKETPAVEKLRPVPQPPVQKPAPAEKKEVPKAITVEALEEFVQKSLPAEQETASKNKIAQATSTVSAAPKAAAVTQTPAQPEKKEEPKKHSDGLSADRTALDMQVEQTLREADRMLLGMHATERANEVFHKAGKRGFKNGTELSDIQKQNLQRYIAGTSFIPMVEGLLDTTILQSGKEGILVTQWSFDWTLHTTTHTGVKVPLMKVVGVRNGKNPGYLRINLSDGKELDMQFGVYADGIRALLETFVEFNQKSLPVKQETASARSAAPAVKTAKKAPKVFSLEQAFADANQKMGRYAKSQFTAFEDASIKQMRNLKKVLGKKIPVDVVDIEGLWGFDDAKGKEGVVVTEDKLYSTWMEWASVEYRRVTHVANGSRDTQIQITYEGQKPEEIWFADHCSPIKAFLQACIDQRT